MWWYAHVGHCTLIAYLLNRSLGQRIRKGSVLTLTIDKLAFGAKGISTLDSGKVVFVADALPQQVVRAKITRWRTKYAEAKLLEVLTRSPIETQVPYQPAPGSPYMRLPLEEQERIKTEMVQETYKHLAGIDLSSYTYDGLISSPAQHHYRNKMEYAFSEVIWDKEAQKMYNGFGFGFKKRGSWLCVDNAEGDTGLFDTEVEDALPKIRTSMTQNGDTAFHPSKHRGVLRSLVCKKSEATGQLLFGLVVNASLENISDEKKNQWRRIFMDLFRERMAGLILYYNEELGDRTLSELPSEVLYGENKLTESLNGLRFDLQLESFFQTNTRSAEKLYERVCEYAASVQLSEGASVLDLYSGAGTITQSLARVLPNHHIIGVELVEQAVQDATKSAELNQIKNIRFVCEDARTYIREHATAQSVELAVVDPPRAGLHPKLVSALGKSNISTIIYVSCNPTTQCRDIREWIESGYRIERYSIVDQFPHTAHIETVFLLHKS